MGGRKPYLKKRGEKDKRGSWVADPKIKNEARAYSGIVPKSLKFSFKKSSNSVADFFSLVVRTSRGWHLGQLLVIEPSGRSEGSNQVRAMGSHPSRSHQGGESS